jgi:hypothetical protein
VIKIDVKHVENSRELVSDASSGILNFDKMLKGNNESLRISQAGLSNSKSNLTEIKELHK